MKNVRIRQCIYHFEKLSHEFIDLQTDDHHVRKGQMKYPNTGLYPNPAKTENQKQYHIQMEWQRLIPSSKP